MENARLMIGEKSLDEKDIATVRSLIASHPTWSRRHLSLELARMWNVRAPSGQWKDMAVRTLLLKLERRGSIVLPLQRQASSRRKPINRPELFDALPPPPVVVEPLAQLLPLEVEVVRPGHPHRATFERYLAHHHYLGYGGPVGEHIDYLVRDRNRRDVACLLFSGAAWKTQPRDAYLGWDATTRARQLSYLTNNTRFLILPWVRVPHLASHLLGLLVRRLSSDWKTKYNHPIYLVETFVERDRFKGTCYRAANWIKVGQTKGRTRNDRHTTLRVPIKDIYLYPLIPDFREKLCHANA